MHAPPIITLTTDFGPSSPYVAAMKGVILSINPSVRLIDITHAIPPQQVLQGAQVLAETTPFFPIETIHVAVVDPEVGTNRKLLYAEFPWGKYVCPDNGLLSRLAARAAPIMIVTVTAERFFLDRVAPTFHGRDMMAPVAAHLSLGLDPAELGPPCRMSELRQLDWHGADKLANRIQGEIVSVDSFGNLITNITRDMLKDVPRDETVAIRCDGHETRSLFSTYADQPPLTLVALVGSNDQLELAIVNESAKMMLGVGVGTAVEVTWQ